MNTAALKGHGDLLTILSPTASFSGFISLFHLPCSNQTELAVPHAVPQLRVFELPIPFVWKALPLKNQMANAFFMTVLNEVYPYQLFKIWTSHYSMPSFSLTYSIFSKELTSSYIYIFIVFLQSLEKDCIYSYLSIGMQCLKIGAFGLFLSALFSELFQASRIVSVT